MEKERPRELPLPAGIIEHAKEHFEMKLMDMRCPVIEIITLNQEGEEMLEWLLYEYYYDIYYKTGLCRNFTYKEEMYMAVLIDLYD
jgi:hypothetical protein